MLSNPERIFLAFLDPLHFCSLPLTLFTMRSVNDQLLRESYYRHNTILSSYGESVRGVIECLTWITARLSSSSSFFLIDVFLHRVFMVLSSSLRRRRLRFFLTHPMSTSVHCTGQIHSFNTPNRSFPVFSSSVRCWCLVVCTVRTSIQSADHLFLNE